ncbi:mRNA interferase MqsR [bacterium BMS3Abin10]|nr:mRNA interferase MqsR [bacterium BMS3Abin10]
MDSSKPTYDLANIKKLLCDSSSCHITKTAHIGAAELGYMDQEAIIDAIEEIQEEDFYKSMPSTKKKRLFQDVYHLSHDGNELYIKLQLSVNSKKVVIIQFKEK